MVKMFLRGCGFKVLALLVASLSLHHAQAMIPGPQAGTYPGVIALEIDATDLERKIFTVREIIPVKPGHLVLLYPQWVPGSHAPIGSIIQMTGLRLSAGGRPLAWTRDPVDVFAFHVEVPPQIEKIEAQFEFASPLQATQGRVVMSNDMLLVQFDRLLLYPAGVHSDGIRIAARLRLPAKWQYATALETASQVDAVVEFKSTDLTTLVDSPLMAGKRLKTFQLGTDPSLPVRLNAFGERDDALAPSETTLAPHREMVTQAYKLFGAPPYKHYDFLMAFSDAIGSIGREHWQSAEITVPATYFADISNGSLRSFVVPHEFVHAWVGKFRRPADLITANFNMPMQNSLLWVYEGQTQYLGFVLQTRAKFQNSAATRDSLAAIFAGLDLRRGRSWRNLQDTVYDDIMGSRATPRGWTNWQRQGGDYYNEGALLWLGVDARLRSLTNERKSLDDFVAAFYADAPAAARQPKAYRFEDIVAALNKIAPFDWATLLRARLDGHDEKILDEDLPLSGWKLVYNNTPNAWLTKVNKDNGSCDVFNSLGLAISKTDVISSVRWDSPAFEAGLTGGAMLLGVNGRVFKCSDLSEAVAAGEGRNQAIELIIKRDRELKLVSLRYNGGLRYPHLERVVGVPDRLEQILTPR